MKTLKELAREVLDIDARQYDITTLSGKFTAAMNSLAITLIIDRTVQKDCDLDKVSCHPIATMWVDKLVRVNQGLCVNEEFSSFYKKVKELACAEESEGQFS